MSTEIVKLPKEKVHYRGTIGQDRCGKCAMYHHNHICDLVLGTIEAHKVCDRWVPR